MNNAARSRRPTSSMPMSASRAPFFVMMTLSFLRSLTPQSSTSRATFSGSGAADIRAAQELDIEFHRCYEQAASGPRLLAKLATLHARRERYIRVYTEALFHTHRQQESFDEHGAIVAAIALGDADAAERHAVFNHRNALERYWQVATGPGGTQGWN